MPTIPTLNSYLTHSWHSNPPLFSFLINHDNNFIPFIKSINPQLPTIKKNTSQLIIMRLPIQSRKLLLRHISFHFSYLSSSHFKNFFKSFSQVRPKADSKKLFLNFFRLRFLFLRFISTPLINIKHSTNNKS